MDEDMSQSGYSRCREWLLAGPHVPLPRHLIVEITSYCNLRCGMCPKTHHAVNTEENKKISWGVFEKLMPLLPHIESLDLSGVWGEAMLHPDLYIDMLKAIKANGVDVYTTSNGTLITEDLARQIVECDLNKLMVSLDAATSETYATIRPPGRLEDVLEGLGHIQSWKKKLNRTQPRVELSFVGMRLNIEEFPAVVRLAHQVGAEQVNLQAMGEYPGFENESIAAHDKALGRQFFEEGRRIGEEHGIDVVLMPPDQFEEDREAHNYLPDHTKYQKRCGDLWNRAVIAATGDVLPCCASPVSLGNLNDLPFDQIWRGQPFSKLRQQFLGGTPPKMCMECTGMGWVEKSVGSDAQFFFGSLLAPRMKRRVKHCLKRYRAARWVKRNLDLMMGRAAHEQAE